MNDRLPLCVIAGAGPGMGTAIARRFARGGHRLALMARDSAALESAARPLRSGGAEVLVVPVDLSKPADVACAFADVREAAGDPSVLVYNAARWNQIAALEIAPDAFTADLALSITGALACVQQVAPPMLAARRGTLLFTGGGLALAPQFGAGVASLAAGKAGMRALVYAIERELAGSGLRIGTVTIAGTVAPGTAFDPDLIAERYWHLHEDRDAPLEQVFDGK